jgi:peptide/nickel transport system permease protein
MEGQVDKITLREKEIQSQSLNAKAWKRLKRNRSAMFGLVTIIISVLLAVFAYALAPDNSPSANEQILQLETHPPGFSIKILKKHREGAQKSSLLSGLWNGFAKDYEPMPITDYSFKNDSLLFTEYMGKSFKPEAGHIAFSDLLGTAAAGKSLAEQKDFIEHQLIEKRTYWLGTDKFGRDILSRLLIGVRVSLSVGLISVGISLIIGIFLGALAGYFRGWVDEAIMFVINVFWSIPTILLAMGLYIGAGSLIENKLVMIFIAVGLTMWVDTARIVRGQFIVSREMEFVTAAKSLGFDNMRIIFRHIVPNIWGPIIVVACANFANAILVESGLSYIGLGIQPPAPSWGSMLNEYKDFIDSNKAYLALFPGIAIMLLVLAFNLVGNGLRDALDVKGQLE